MKSKQSAQIIHYHIFQLSDSFEHKLMSTPITDIQVSYFTSK